MDADEANDHIPFDSNIENEKEKVANENENDEINNENDKNEEKINETPIEEEQKTFDHLISSQDYSSADSQALESEVSSQTEVGSSQPNVFSDSQPENSKSVTAKPKKKIFSNRDRSKVEFNTKSFFNSAVKDEFDMEIDDQPASGASSTNADKKNGHENDEDPDQYIKLKRIKKAHQCHDLGETEQFDEDIKYYLSGIVATNTNSMRCLRFVIL